MVASTNPAYTCPAAISDAVSVDAAMLAATIVPAWMVADASNLNGAHAAPSHWEISPVALRDPDVVGVGVGGGAGGDGDAVRRRGS